MTRLVLVGADLTQLMELAAVAGREFSTTSLIHTSQVLERGRDFVAMNDCVVVLCIDAAVDLESLGADPAARIIVVGANTPGACGGTPLVLGRADAARELKTALRHLLSPERARPERPIAPMSRWSGARGRPPACKASQVAG